MRLARTARRAVDWVFARTVEPVVLRLGNFVRRRAERRVDRVGAQLPEPPRWFGAVAAVIGVALSLSAWAVGEWRSRSRETASERAEPSETAERCRDPSEPSEPGLSEEAREVIEALDTLGVEYPPPPTEDDAKEAWREKALETHPDKGGDTESFKEVREAWIRIETGQELSAVGEEEK